VIRAVTFDAAGTLVAPREPVGATYARVAAAHGIAADPAAVERGFRRAMRAAPPLAFPGVAGPALAERERAWWRDVVRAALGAAAAHPRFDAAFAATFDHYAAAEAWTVFADVVPTLQALRADGLRLGVVSNFDGRLPGLLERLGLAPSFGAIVWSSAVGAAKPSREPFAEAIRRLGVAPPETLHVGDDPDADVDGARRAGLAALRVDRAGTDPDAVRSLAEVPPRLATLTRTGR
jgi:putative hydrolase of the HAD superfamily